MPPPGHEPLQRAICENPPDDAPRLVYADWLEEHGDPDRAEFIRVQVERARARARGEDWPDLAERDRALRLIAEARWRPELPRRSGVNWQRFWRGFVSGAEFVKGRWFAANAATVFAATPVQFLRIVDLGEQHAPTLAACPLVARLDGLSLHNDGSWIGPHGWRELGQSQHFVNLKWLTLSASWPARFGPNQGELPPVLDRESARYLANSTWAPRLERLEIAGGSLTVWVAEELRQAFGDRFRHSSALRQ